MKNLVLIGLVWLAGVIQAQKINSDLVSLVKEPAVKTATAPPVLIMLHGYGSNESDLFELSKTIDQRFLVFSIRAPYPAGNGYAWYRLDFLPAQQFGYDYRETQQSRTKLLSFISQACAAYSADSSQVFIMGFSQGAMMAYDLALSSPKRIKGVLALSGRMMDESKAMKTDWVRVAAVKFFIAHGNSDNVIKIGDAEKSRDFLRSKKVGDLSYNTYEMPHSLSGQELNDIRRWLVKAIAPESEAPKK